MSSVSAVNTLLSGTTTTTPAVSISSILAATSGASTPGIDVTAAVAAAIYADRAPERGWQADQTTLTSQTTALTSIQTATEALATDMQSLNTLTGPLAARTVTSSNPNDLTATAATGTAAGVHTVVVNSLATTGSWYSDLETGPTALLPASSMTITTTAGPAVTIAIGNGVNTLNDLATAINSATSTTSYSSTQANLTGATPLTTGSITTIQDTATGKSFSYTAVSGDTIDTLNAKIASAVADGTLSAKVVGSAASGQEVISEGSTGEGITVSTTDVALGAMDATAGATESLGLNATVVSDSTGSRLAIISKTSGTASDFSITSANYTGTSWTSPDMPPGSTLGANSITLSSGTGPSLATLTVSTAATTPGQTYAQLATAINAAVSAFNLTANTNGTPPLNVTATAGSDANGTNITIASSDKAVTPFTINEPGVGFTQAVTAANASLTVDGVPIHPPTNSVTGAITGVTLTLLGASLGSPINLTVASDAAQVSTAINQFATDYNTAIGLVNSQFSFDSTANTQGVLGSDPTVVSLQSTLEQALSFVNKPPAGGSTTVSTLSDLGLSVGNDGTLTVDSATLDNAITNNAADVQSFFEGASLNGFANSMYTALNNFTSPANGAFKVDLSSISSSSAALTSEINDYETGYIASQQTALTAEFSAAEIALQTLPEEMAQLNAELGFNSNGSSSG
jgi:flagellar hook-associated protein 2